MSKNTEVENKKERSKINEKEVETKDNECFVIMPIGDHPSHEKGHFGKIYRDLIKPAVEDADFRAYRADEGGGSQNIQIDIIEKIIKAPMAVCDLSTRNPNVLFELGIRQAFDLPVALIQEVGTDRIFDINTFNTGEYRSNRIYDEVIEDRANITKLIKTTFEKHKNGEGINSIISLIPSLQPAKINNRDIKSDELLKIMFQQINSISEDVSNLRRQVKMKRIDEVALDRYNDLELMNALEDIPPIDSEIFKMLYGLEGGRYSTKEVAKRFNLDEMCVKRTYNDVGIYLRNRGIKLYPRSII